MKTETLWESQEYTPSGDPFLTVKRANSYFYYGVRGGKDSIAFILKDKNKNKYALISEEKPPLFEDGITHLTTAFGGSIDCDNTIEEICLFEVFEEAGYDVRLDDIEYLGDVLVSTQMNQMCHLFIVDVTDYYKSLPIEGGTEVMWLSKEEIINLQDWKAITILVKAKEI